MKKRGMMDFDLKIHIKCDFLFHFSNLIIRFVFLGPIYTKGAFDRLDPTGWKKNNNDDKK